MVGRAALTQFGPPGDVYEEEVRPSPDAGVVEFWDDVGKERVPSAQASMLTPKCRCATLEPRACLLYTSDAADDILV